MMLIGIDLVSQKQFNTIYETVKNFKNTLFTENEREFSVSQLASNFAAKEALFKMMDNLGGSPFKEVEVLRYASGKPYFKFYGETLRRLRNYQINLSISHKDGSVIAVTCAYESKPPLLFEIVRRKLDKR